MQSINDREENEIDLLDLLNILYRDRVYVIAIALLTTFAALVVGLYIRANTTDKLAIDIAVTENIDEYYLDKASLNVVKFDEEKILRDNNLIDELFLVNGVNEVFSKNKKSSYNDKRLFLSEIVNIKNTTPTNQDQSIKYYQLLVREIAGIDSKELLSKYIMIIEEEKKKPYLEAIVTGQKSVALKSMEYDKKLAEINKKVNNKMDEQADTLLMNEGIKDTLFIKYPELMNEQERVEELSNKYKDKVVGMEGIESELKSSNQVQEVSSFYIVESNSRAKVIALLGPILGLALGTCFSLVKEFLLCLKNNIKYSKKNLK